jgi:hypothetical protein
LIYNLFIFYALTQALGEYVYRHRMVGTITTGVLALGLVLALHLVVVAHGKILFDE